jgi:O-antigen/teichoic acid export membrane protein
MAAQRSAFRYSIRCFDEPRGGQTMRSVGGNPPGAVTTSMSETDSVAVTSGNDTPLAVRASTRRSLVSGGAFALGNAAQRIFAFLLLPAYTAVLSPAEFGRLGLLITIQAGLSVALSAGMETGVFRHYFYLEGDPLAQRRFVMSAWKSLIVAAPALALIVAVLLVSLAPASAVFRPDEVAVAVMSAAVLVAATIVPLTVLRAEQRLKNYITLTLVAGISTAVLTVLLVVVLRQGVISYFVATLIANCITLAAAVYVIPWARRESFDRVGMRRTLAIALPLIPHTLSHWSLVLMDRAMLAVLVIPSALGIYTLASNLALPALILVLSLTQGFMPSYARAQKVGPDAARELRDTITAQVLLVFFIGCATALLAPVAVFIMAASYSGAAPLVPWLALGYVFLGIYYVPMNSISLIVGRTTFVWVFTVFAATVNLGMIYLLVPKDGLMAAAVASAVGYLVLLVSITIYALKLRVRLSIDWWRILRGALLFGCAYTIGVYLTPDHGMAGLFGRSVILVVAIGVVGHMSGLRLSALVSRLRGVLSPRDMTPEAET